MVEKFYNKTGMYIDWQQIESLPEIDTLIDIGVGTHGTEDFIKVKRLVQLARLQVFEVIIEGGARFVDEVVDDGITTQDVGSVMEILPE